MKGVKVELARAGIVVIISCVFKKITKTKKKKQQQQFEMKE